MGVELSEQETLISWMRGDKHAEIYTTDRTTMTKLDRKCKEHPESWKIKDISTVKGEIVSKTYICPRKLISFRNSDIHRDFSANIANLKQYQKAETEDDDE